MEEFSRQGRGGQGVRAHKLHADRGRVVTGLLVDDGDDVILINDAGVVIRTAVDSISVQGRSATGVRVMNLDEESKVVAVARVLPDDDDDDGDGADDGGAAAADGASAEGTGSEGGEGADGSDDA